VLLFLFIYLLFLFFNPRKKEGRKKLKKLRKNGEANVPSGRPTQNCCVTKQNWNIIIIIRRKYWFRWSNVKRLQGYSKKRKWNDV